MYVCMYVCRGGRASYANKFLVRVTGRVREKMRNVQSGTERDGYSHDGSSSIESYSPRSKMPDNKPQGLLDAIGVGSAYCYQIPSFSVITVELRNVRVSFWDDEEKRTGIYDLFMREDPSVRKRFPDGGWSLLPAIPSSHRISGLFAPRVNKGLTVVMGKHKT